MLAWPTPLLPLAGAAVGLFFGLVFGWLATQRTGVYFAMVTLAMAELLFTLAPTWTSVFGGESGISTMRMNSWAINFATDTGVYYLTLGLGHDLDVVPVGVHADPDGAPGARAARERASGALPRLQHPRRPHGDLRHLAMFTGVAGALLAITNEATNYTIFSAQASANVVLQTFIGGAGTFFGPALGAAIMTFFARVMSDLTRSWLLYQGVVFVIVMLFAPDGIGGLISLHARRLRASGGPAPDPALPAVPRRRGLLLIAGVVFIGRERARRAVGSPTRCCGGPRAARWCRIRCSAVSSIRGLAWTWAIPVVSMLARRRPPAAGAVA